MTTCPSTSCLYARENLSRSRFFSSGASGGCLHGGADLVVCNFFADARSLAQFAPFCAVPPDLPFFGVLDFLGLFEPRQLVFECILFYGFGRGKTSLMSWVVSLAFTERPKIGRSRLRSFVDSRLRSLHSFALRCVFLHPTAFRTTVFGNLSEWREAKPGAF